MKQPTARLTTKKKILIIDDDKYITEAMQRLLDGFSYQVEAFATGKDGLERAFVSPPDIILLDYHLPSENTQAIVDRLHTSGTTKNIPIVLISASHTAELAATQWNLTAFLEKPFQVNTLLQLVQKYTI